MHVVETTPMGPRSAADVLAELRNGAAQSRPVLPTGFDPLDHVLEGGLRCRDLTLVGGLPGVGKTVATLQWARHLASEGYTAIFVCYEHDPVSLLTRLLLSEIGSLSRSGATVSDQGRLRTLIRDVAVGACRLGDVAASDPLVGAAYQRLSAYADRIWLVAGSATDTDLDALRAMVAERADDRTALLVDYLQKVALAGPGLTETDRISRVAAGLKDIALTEGVAVVSVVAGDGAALDTRRMRVHHLRGSGSLAYEADVIVMLNEKYTAVSKRHSAYDPVRAEAFKNEVIFTIEKNRDGPARLDMEFRKDFQHYRFVPSGVFVADRLIDERMFPE